MTQLRSSGCGPAPTREPRWRHLHQLALLAFFVRLGYALVSSNFHHPDELFQSLEQAHRLVFGYGTIPWEFRYGTRSWVPIFFAAVPLYACKVLAIDVPTVYVPLIKAMFCLLSTWLVFSGYTIGKNLVSETAGRLAAVYCGFWYELIYFAPRPLSDVVAAYFLVAAIACLVDQTNRTGPPFSASCSARLWFFVCNTRLLQASLARLRFYRGPAGNLP